MTPEHVDVVVIGSGLVGAAVAHDLTRWGVSALVLESSSEVGAGASRSNSGILHTGFDSEPGALETEMILTQGKRWRQVFESVGVPYRVTGAMLLANDDEQREGLPALAENAAVNGVEVAILDRKEAKRLEPGTRSVGALLVAGEAITDPFEVVRRLLATVPKVKLSRRVTGISQEAGGLIVETEEDPGFHSQHGENRGHRAAAENGGERFSAEFVVNCAGLYGDEVAGDGSFTIRPRRGEFVVYPKGSASLLDHILLPFPTTRTKGVLVFPTVHGHLCAGPSAVDQDDKEDWRPRRSQLEEIAVRASSIFPPAASLSPSDSWAGLRPVGEPRNYFIEWSTQNPSLLHVGAIRSTGLSGCLGISQHVLGLLAERGLKPKSEPPDLQLPVFDDLEPWWSRLNSFRKVDGPC